MNYTFTNKNKRNKDKLLCKNFSKYYFDFLVINNIFLTMASVFRFAREKI